MNKTIFSTSNNSRATFSSINCTPFEAGHGLRARTITEARANPRLQIMAEGGMDIDDADKNWEKSLFPKVYKLAERLASVAQSQSQWHKRMNAQSLNQAGEKTLPHLQIIYLKKPTIQHDPLSSILPVRTLGTGE